VACILAAAFALLATVSASARAAAGAGARAPLLRERLKQSELVDRFVAAIKADGRLAKAAERYGLEPIVVHE
jgi:hypothetical protein